MGCWGNGVASHSRVAYPLRLVGLNLQSQPACDFSLAELNVEGAGQEGAKAGEKERPAREVAHVLCHKSESRSRDGGEMPGSQVGLLEH